MNERMPAHRGFDPRRLPEFTPDPALWSRIAANYQRRLARRRRWTAGVLGAAVAATLAVVVGVPTMHHAERREAVGYAIQDQSRALEDEWTTLLGGRTPAIGTTHLRVIDAELQAAYDRGAATEELFPLWQQRNQALRGLIDGVRNGAVGRDASLTQI